MDVQISGKYNGMDVIIHVTDMDYYKGRSACGPSFSCAGEPPEPAEAVPTEGWVELDCPYTYVKAAVDVQLSDTVELFDELCVDYETEIEDALLDYVDEHERAW